MKIDYGALGSVGILIAIFRDPTHPKSAVFLGSYLIDIEANRDSMADKTRTTKAAFIVDSKDPTQYKQVSSDNGTGSMREGILHRRELFELRAGRWGKLLHHIMGDMEHSRHCPTRYYCTLQDTV